MKQRHGQPRRTTDLAIVGAAVIAFALSPMLDGCRSQQPVKYPSPPSAETKGAQANCSLSFSGDKTILTFRLKGGDKSVELDIPEGIEIRDPKIIAEGRTVLITKDKIIVTLGLQDVEQGKQMLGMVGDELVPQNTLIYDMSALGGLDPKKSALNGNLLFIETMGGDYYVINIDSSTPSAKHVKGLNE